MNGNGPAKSEDRPLLDTVLDEQSERWEQGAHPPVEDYLARYPALLDNTEAVIDLVYQELLLRRQSGESPDAEEYVRRFPGLSEAIIRQFAVDEAMRTADDLTKPSIGGLAFGAGQEAMPPDRVSRLPAIDGYELLNVLGRGGMGIVYKARDVRLGRIVAIKTIVDVQHATPEQLGRFLAEAEVVARLQHPHIIQIHAVGEQEGLPYFSLEYAEGGSLARRLALGPMAAGPAALLVETLARAVQIAHRRGVVHRDLKPSNVLLTADDVPKVADFGLAKLIGGDSVRTLSGEALGTPSYMAPEQAEGHSRDVGPAADVYALGAILYHALTGRPPFLGDSAIETLKLVASTEVVPPRRHRPGVPRDLETICLKCLEKDHRKRYVSAEALAHDLRSFREAKPIVARPVGPVGRLWRWGVRNPTLSVTSAALILGFAMGTPSLFLLWLQARGDRNRAETARDRALAAVRILLTTGAKELTEEARPYRKALIAAGLIESQALVRELEKDPRAENQRVEAYTALAEVQHENGDHAAALDSARKAVSLAESLVARDPASVRFRTTLATALQRLVYMRPDEDEYLAAARRSSEICRALCAQHPEGDVQSWTRLIGMNHFNIGGLHFYKGRFSQATDSLLAARTAFQTVLDLGDHSPKMLDTMARTHLYLCRLYSNRKQFDDAMASGRESTQTFRTLVANHPDDIEHGFQLDLADQEIGHMCVAFEKWDQAIKSYESARKTVQKMAARQGLPVSMRARIQTALAEVDQNLCDAYDSDPARYAAAKRAIIREAYEICEKIGLVQPLTLNLRIVSAHQCYETVEYQEEDGERPDLEALKKSEQLLADVLEQSPSNRDVQTFLVTVRRKLADLLEARGQTVEAARCRLQSLTTARRHADLFYEIASNYAKRSEAVGLLPTRLDFDKLQARRQRFAADATAMLREAVADGFKDAKRLRDDRAFASIRSTPEFQAIVCDLEIPSDPFARP